MGAGGQRVLKTLRVFKLSAVSYQLSAKRVDSIFGFDQICLREAMLFGLRPRLLPDCGSRALWLQAES
jgi:hypothetical protein